MTGPRAAGHAAQEASDAERASPLSPSILHVYSGNLYGGIETLLSTLARSGHLEPSMRMEYALCFPGRLCDELRAADAVVHDLGPVQFRYPWTIARARRRLARLLDERRFDFVVTHACWPHSVLAPTVRRANTPIVFWQHDFVGTGHWVERLAARTRPDLAVSNSHASAATLFRLFPGVPAEVVYCPVSPPMPSTHAVNERTAIRRELGTPEDAVVVIQACRMERWKGHALLLEALGRLRDRPDWIAWIVGGAQRPHERVYLAELEARAEAAGIADRIRFLGQRADVPRLLAAADLYCQPNTEPEPFGIALIEALYAGLPVISTRMGGAAEILTEDCGVLVEPGDAAALAGVLRGLIADPSARSRFSSTGPARAAELCDPRRVLHRFSGLLSGLATSIGVKSTS